MPKPSVPMVNRPMIWYMVDWLARHGVSDVVMSVGFLADGLRAALDETGHVGMSIRYVEEPEPLGTAGAVKFAEQYLDERFLVLNGDVLTDFDITAEIAQHEQSGARATLALVPVDDPTAYGLVLTGENNAIESFLEKPDAADVPPNPRINAGGYVLEREILEMIPAGEKRSFELDVFPQLVGNGIYAYDADSYWLDLGTPDRYVEATRALLDGEVSSWLSSEIAATGNSIATGSNALAAEIQPPVVIDENVTVGPGTQLGAYTVIGRDVETGANCRLSGAVIMRGCLLGEGVSVTDALIGPGVQIGAGATIEANTVIGEGARVEPGARIAANSRIDADSGVAA
jgi:mannose-1-phosphate guanylyltransferase